MSIETFTKNYIATRDAFNAAGGADFLAERRELRTEYCRANATYTDFSAWFDAHANKAVQQEGSNRIREWDNKLAKGLLKRAEATDLPVDAIVAKVQAFYTKYADFLSQDTFAKATQAKAALRTALLPELKDESAKTVASRHNITDRELIDRMAFEWKQLKT